VGPSHRTVRAGAACTRIRRAVLRPHEELREIDSRIADCKRRIDGFRDGRIHSGHVERSVRKQQAKIAELEAARVDAIRQLDAQAEELADSSDPRHAAVLVWQRATDAHHQIGRERNVILAEINARFTAARAAGDPGAEVVHHREWQATMKRYQELLDAALARTAAAFDELVEIC